MIERVSLFNTKRDFFLFVLASGFILFYSLLIEYQNYKRFTRFDSQIVKAEVLKEFAKTKDSKTYQVLKLKSKDGLLFYTGTKKPLKEIDEKELTLEIFAGKISFYQYLTSFYTYSKIKKIYKDDTLKQQLNSNISSLHSNKNIANIYQALYTAAPLNKELQTAFSTLGISHLLAISGFHLGVLSTLLFFIIRPVYSFVQDRYFPYRNSKSETFAVISIILLSYMLFLDSPASLLRAFGMLVVGFILYDRGIKIVSMQTLLLTVVILLIFFPRLFFSLGFWLSASGVFYIFLFLIHFKDIKKIWQFILLPFWVYLLMLPFSLVIFGNFSIYHPLSVLWTTLFTLFYPLSIFLHVIGYADLFDTLLESMILLADDGVVIGLSIEILALHILLSLLAVFRKLFIFPMLIFDLSLFIYAVYHVA